MDTLRVLITGAAGLLGNALMNECRQRGWQVIGIDNGFRGLINEDVIAYDTVDFVSSESCDFDIVFHMSAINGTKFFYDMPNEVIYNNVTADLAVFKWVDQDTRLVYASSSEVISGNSVPTAEDVDITIKNIHNPRWSYRLGKILSENYLTNSNLNYVVTRYFNVFGENSSLGHFVWDIIQKLAIGNNDLIGGFETRSFCYDKDAAWATVELALTKANEVVNIGNPEELTIITAANIVARQFHHSSIDWQLQPGRAGSAYRRAVNIDRLKTHVPNFDPRSFEQAVKELYLTMHS